MIAEWKVIKARGQISIEKGLIHIAWQGTCTPSYWFSERQFLAHVRMRHIVLHLEEKVMSTDEIAYWLDHLEFLTVDQLYDLVDAIQADREMTVVASANHALRVKRCLRRRGFPGVRVDVPPTVHVSGRLLHTRTCYGAFQVFFAGRWRQRREFADECPRCLMPLAYYRDGDVVLAVCHTCGHTTEHDVAWIRQQNGRIPGNGWERIKRLREVANV